jgi:hypothetical protein
MISSTFTPTHKINFSADETGFRISVPVLATDGGQNSALYRRSEWENGEIAEFEVTDNTVEYLGRPCDAVLVEVESYSRD